MTIQWLYSRTVPEYSTGIAISSLILSCSSTAINTVLPRLSQCQLQQIARTSNNEVCRINPKLKCMVFNTWKVSKSAWAKVMVMVCSRRTGMSFPSLSQGCLIPLNMMWKGYPWSPALDGHGKLKKIYFLKWFRLWLSRISTAVQEQRS